jgi:hypothetical protein
MIKGVPPQSSFGYGRSLFRRAVLSQLLRYEQVDQFPISYVAALFKELRFQPAVEMVEAANPKHGRPG